MLKKNKTEKNIFTVVNHQSRNRLGISIVEYCIADSIYHLSNNPTSKVPGWSYINQDALAMILGVNRRTIIRSEKRLIDRGLLERKGQLLRITKTWYDVVVLDDSIKVTKCHFSGNKKRQNVTSKSDKMSLHSIYINNDNNKDIDSRSSSMILLGGSVDDPTYHRNIDDDGIEITHDSLGRPYKKGPRVKKEPKNKIVQRIQYQFVDLCRKKIGIAPIADTKGYYAVLYAMNTGKLDEKRILDLFDEWFGLGKPDQETIQITRALSANQINNYKVRNNVRDL